MSIAMTTGQNDPRQPKQGWFSSRWAGTNKTEKTVLIGFAALMGFGVLTNIASRDQQAGPAPSSTYVAGNVNKVALPSPQRRIEDLQPASQQAFVRALADARNSFKEAANEMAAGGFRRVRARSICSSVPGRSVEQWVGKIGTLTSNSEGKGVLSIEIGKDMWIKTWNNSLSDIGDRTLIDPDSRVFSQVSQLKPGQYVAFSGSFIPSDTDCFRETSMSLAGSMKDPEFVMRFSSVMPFNP